MADKSVMAQIEKYVSERAVSMLEPAVLVMVKQPEYTDEAMAEALVSALLALSDSWRAEARLWDNSGSKGWKSTAASLRDAAEKLDAIIPELRAKPPFTQPPREPLNAEQITGLTPGGDGGGLDALIEQAKQRETDRRAFLAGAMMPAADDTSIAVGDIGSPATFEVVETLDQAIESVRGMNVLMFTRQADAIEYENPNATPELVKEIADMTETFPMFSDPAPITRQAYTAPALRDARRVTYAELMSPPPQAPVEHVSHSQENELADCGLKYRLSRLHPDIVQLPAWWHVGGTSVHAFVEWVERAHSEVKTWQYLGDRIKTAGGVNVLWRALFHEEITKTLTATPDVPMDQWRAAKQGKEAYTWWLIEGSDMCQRYVAQRDHQDGRTILRIDGEPVIEYQAEMDVDGVPWKGVIDQAWLLSSGDIEIVDAKSGAHKQTSTYQLGEYAWFLRMEQVASRVGNETNRIWGRFWDARSGEYTERVDLLAAHPYDEMRYRVGSTAANKAAGAFPARVSSFCGSCPVKHACPTQAPVSAS